MKRIKLWLLSQLPHLEDFKQAIFLARKMRKRPVTQEPVSGIKDKRIIDLHELNFQASSFLPFFYFILNSKNHNREVYCYLPWSEKGNKEKISWRIKSFFVGKYSSQILIYRFIGVKKFIRPKNIDKFESQEIYNQVLSKINNLNDILEISIKDIWVGDLIYDQYLRRYQKGTINLDDAEWLNFLYEACYTTLFWIHFFRNNPVNSVNVGHTCYFQAIPSRVAVHEDIKSFIIMPDRAFHISSENLYDDAEYFRFPEIFESEIPEEMRAECLLAAQKKIESLFVGELGIDRTHMEVSGFSSRELELSFNKNKTNVLVAMHCFSDGPNSFGKNLFPDFVSWFNFLDEIAKDSNFIWHIKPHPAFNRYDKTIFNELTQNKPWWNVLDVDTSHKSLVKERIDLVLTMYGTIGFEFAYHGYTVVNASRVNPHIAYNFNLHPSSIEEYRNIILNPEDHKPNISLNKIHEYYFMRFIRETNHIFFQDYNAMTEYCGGYFNQWDSRAVFEFTRNNWNQSRDELIRKYFFDWLERPERHYRYLPPYLKDRPISTK